MSDRSEADCVSNDLVERVAQRLCNTAGSNWHAENFNQTDDGCDPEDQREYYRMLARAAIPLMRPAIREGALEEAAKVAEECAPVSQDTWSTELAERCDMVAAAIRALINGDKND